ncbi:ARF/SAR superfamily protein [Heterostelium album PN500]|uniref:ARF/SAR superfamily protein n=1 Tax=Heterostelium pallidum (strain ATCC 26659 / Pp 5 / PN500) TaxID=670386 RepID=D3BBI7_HETP5|nr:ARF/SAR superfamily protein [Heterostelium album PN500]EFA81020.1 ARF/SAR superfamily protein [Heterostelium album PN500]|eukprot:XP_020433138.1 ARF/SAR superfamily protein [Heterostelium album PN500]
MFLFDWFEAFLNWLGFLKKEGSLIIIGLGNAGKTTLLQVLSKDVLKAHMPTQRPHMDHFVASNVTFKAWDLGGQQGLRALWRNYTAGSSDSSKLIVIFMVDTTDPQQLGEAKAELHDALEYTNGAPMLIVGSKIDRPGLNREQLIQALDLNSHMLGLNENSPRIMDVLMVSSVSRKGVPELMNWLSKCHSISNK